MIDASMFTAIAIVSIVIVLQIIKFTQNRKRINLFSKIFAGQDYDLEKNSNDMVVGITGSGNEIFEDIKISINGYLGGTQGTEVDFQLLKDSVDRHCDMIEDEINSQMPLPLYFGLAGTMLGAIVGLFSLVWGGAILELMSGVTESTDPSAIGVAGNINDLLWGVALAMGASALGIILTSVNTIYFKNKKLQEETDKNKFLAWMQSRVLSAVPSGISQQMKALVNQLASFNRNFRSNTDSINETLSTAKEVYQSQADVIAQYKEIDLEAIAEGVSGVLRRLKSSTESLDNFTAYLELVHKYYKEMQAFAEKLNEETERIGILQDIQKFFQSHKAVIAEETTEAHKNLRESIKAVQNSTEEQVKETYIALTEQSQKLKDAISENNEQFNCLCREMREKFKEQMDAMPSVAQSLKKLEYIPGMLETAIAKMTQSQERLISEFLKESKRVVPYNGAAPVLETGEVGQPSSSIPKSIKWTIVVGVILMTLATIGNTAYNIWKGEKAPTVEVSDSTVSTPIVTQH
jgi:phosphate uptake regulator